MKVTESLKKCQNGVSNVPSLKPAPSTSLPNAMETPMEETHPNVRGTTMNGCVSGEKLSTASRSSSYSISDVESSVEDDAWLNSEHDIATESDAESSDLDTIVTTGADVCHAATLETFLENLEFVPAEVNRMLKLIGTLDEKCEEIMELLDRPSEEWFTLHRSKKQKKLQVIETSTDGLNSNAEGVQGNGGNGSKDMMIYRKIYEGQEGIGFEAYKTRLTRARKLEKQREIERISTELVAIPDGEFHVVYDKAHEESPQGDASKAAASASVPVTNSDEHVEASQTKSVKGWDACVESTSEIQDGNKKAKTIPSVKDKQSMDAIDMFFYQVEHDAAAFQQVGGDDDFMDIDGGGSFQLDEAVMGEDWKDQLDEILQENELNQVVHNDMETLRTFMESQLALLWRYSLRKKALARKAYEIMLHHYASLVQELEPKQFGATLKCYPEATVVQGALLNELEEQFMTVEEMTELHRDVEALLAVSDDFEDATASLTAPTDGRIVSGHETLVAVKHEEASTATPLRPESKKDRSMDEAYANGQLTSPTLPQMNGTVSGFVPSVGSTPGYPPSGQRLNSDESQSRRHRDKRLKPTKAPAGMSHAAKSPQSTGRLLTYYDIATPLSAAKLSGRLAELFWPHDNLWYLIHIEEIFPDTKSAKIGYTTGETEHLELNDIVREGLLSLLPEADDTDLSAEEDMPLPAAEMEIGEEAVSELSPSDIRAGYLDDPSPDEDDMGSEDDEEEVIANLHRSRQSRRSEIKAENMHGQLKSL